MSKFLDPRVQGALRHLLTSVGPLVASHGWTTEANWQLFTGIGLSLLGFYASWTASEKNPW